MQQRSTTESLTPSYLWSPTDKSEFTDFASCFALAFGICLVCQVCGRKLTQHKGQDKILCNQFNQLTKKEVSVEKIKFVKIRAHSWAIIYIRCRAHKIISPRITQIYTNLFFCLTQISQISRRQVALLLLSAQPPAASVTMQASVQSVKSVDKKTSIS